MQSLPTNVLYDIYCPKGNRWFRQGGLRKREVKIQPFHLPGSAPVHSCNRLILTGLWINRQAPVPEKTIRASRGLNPANGGIKFVLRLDCVPQNTISTIPGIK